MPKDVNLLTTKATRSNVWQTPDDIFNPLNAICRFYLDAAASPENAKCPLYITEEMDSLAVNWLDLVSSVYDYVFPTWVWLNPPYDFLYPWLAKAWRESREGLAVFQLLPPNLDNRWFIELVAPGGETDEEDVECWLYIGGLKDPTPGYKEKSNNISRIAFEDPTTQERSSPGKGNIAVIYYAPGAPHIVLPVNQWRRLF